MAMAMVMAMVMATVMMKMMVVVMMTTAAVAAGGWSDVQQALDGGPQRPRRREGLGSEDEEDADGPVSGDDEQAEEQD